MAIINKAGIGEGGLIQAEHITRIIDSLNETGSYTIVATGSFTGSFTGNGSGLTGVTAGSSATASYVTSSAVDGPYGFDSILTASFAISASVANTASFATTASFAISASAASTASFVNTLNQTVIISGSVAQTNGSVRVARRTLNASILNALDGHDILGTDYIVLFEASTTSLGFKNSLVLPDAAGNDGRILILQRIVGTAACTVSASVGNNVNGGVAYAFPTTLYTQRTFVCNGFNWFTEP